MNAHDSKKHEHKDVIREELRCEKCHKLLAINNGKKFYEIKCVRCGTLNIMLDKLEEQVIVTDPSGTITFVNSMLEKITGYTIQEAIGKRPSLWGGQMSKEFYKKMWESISEKKEGVDVMVVNRKKSGQLYNARLRISPVLDTNGNVMLFIGIETVVDNKK